MRCAFDNCNKEVKVMFISPKGRGAKICYCDRHYKISPTVEKLLKIGYTLTVV